MTQDININNLEQQFSDNQIPTGADFAQLIALANSANQTAMLVSGADLNTAILTGKYRLDKTTYPNLPTDYDNTNPGLLTVTTDDTNSIVYQQIISSANTSNEWNRVAVNGTWTAWKTTGGSTALADASSFTDMDAITTGGWYQASNAISNVPTGFNSGWALQVIKDKNGNVYQHLYGTDGSEYTRIDSNNAWSNWNVLATKTYIDSAVSSVANSANSALAALNLSISAASNVQGLVTQANSYANSVAKLWASYDNQDLRSSMATLGSSIASQASSASANTTSQASSVATSINATLSSFTTATNGLLASNATSVNSVVGSIATNYNSFTSNTVNSFTSMTNNVNTNTNNIATNTTSLNSLNSQLNSAINSSTSLINSASNNANTVAQSYAQSYANSAATYGGSVAMNVLSSVAALPVIKTMNKGDYLDNYTTPGHYNYIGLYIDTDFQDGLGLPHWECWGELYVIKGAEQTIQILFDNMGHSWQRTIGNSWYTMTTPDIQLYADSNTASQAAANSPLPKLCLYPQ